MRKNELQLLVTMQLIAWVMIAYAFGGFHQPTPDEQQQAINELETWKMEFYGVVLTSDNPETNEAYKDFLVQETGIRIANRYEDYGFFTFNGTGLQFQVLKEEKYKKYVKSVENLSDITYKTTAVD